MKLIHLTDIHLTPAGDTIGRRDPTASLDRALAHIEAHHGDADLMVISGDLTDAGGAAEYDRLRERLAAVAMPVALTLGNHDARAPFRAVFPEHCDEAGFAQRVHEAPGARVLMLDTLDEGEGGGRLCRTRLDWLEARLAEHPGPHFIVMHHHPIPSHVIPMDRIGLAEPEAFAAVVARWRGRIAHILHGHCHMNFTGSLHGAPVASNRGPNHVAWPSFGDPVLRMADLPETYGVVIADEGAVTIHVVEFGFPGEVRVWAAKDGDGWAESQAAEG